MKVAFSADIHIKLGQKNVPVEWAKARYTSLFSQMQLVGCDRWIIGGDIFDRVFTPEELEIYFELVASFKKPTIFYSGNHESVKKSTTFLTHLKQATEQVNPLVSIIDDFYTDDLGIDYIPYNKLKAFVANEGPQFSGRVLCTHVRGEIPPHVKPEIDLKLLERWDLVLAGDLHSYENSQLNILYPGSPVTTSFHRNPVDTGVIVLDTDTLEHVWVKLKLPQLIRKTIKAGEPMPATDFDHTIYEVEGDLSSLSAMQDHELLDKKVVKRESDTALLLTKDMSIQTEVDEYLRYVLGLDESTITKALQEFNNHASKFNSL
jgi:Calcineurin-like phosphoesterase